MSKKQPRNTKGKIISAAWKLFYEQGYDDTTIDEIIAESATSKGSFYHYFEGKDALLGSLSFLFDEKYMELEAQLSGFATRYEQLIYLNQELFSMIENSISLDLLARLLSTQLITKGEKHLLDRNRYYYKLLRRIIRDYRFRGYSAEDTINRWPSVRRGEDKWIFPYQENADAMFNSAMLYELAALRKFAEPILAQVPESSKANAEAYRLLRFLRYFNYIPTEELPGTSLLREFLGGGSFKY